LSAILYGIIEGTHVTFGPPTLFNTFIADYHIPMALLMVIICYGYGQLRMIPVWVLMEDLTFWLPTQHYTMTDQSWVCLGLGGLHITDNMFIPFTYLILLCVWLLCEWLYRQFNFNITI
jgi:hypothetical protein